MSLNEIGEKIFLHAFINEFLEYQNHVHYPPIDRLNYSLCISDEEKLEHTNNELTECNKKIKELGFEELSFAYIKSCDSDSREYIESYEERKSFWINRFGEELLDEGKLFYKLENAIKSYFQKSVIDWECFSKEYEFWNWYPSFLYPIKKDLRECLSKEKKIQNEIQYLISEYEENHYWDIGYIEFDEFEENRLYNNSIDNLLKLSELLVQLERRKMLIDFLNYPSDSEESDKMEKFNWIDDLVQGIYELHEIRGNKEPFIREIKNETNEGAFRDWFSEYFQIHDYRTSEEKQIGKKLIDLRIKKNNDTIKFEFKDWRNADMKQIVNQLCSKYLTQFDEKGIIFIINPNRSPIIDKYKAIVLSDSSKAVSKEWKICKNKNFTYYESKHQFGAEKKTIYHFIYNVFP